MFNSLLIKQPVVRIDSPENVYGLSLQPYETRKNISQNIQYVTLDSYAELLKNTEYCLPKRINEGDILVRHPYHENEYVKIQDVEEKVFLDLQCDMEDIARLLGCTRFTWKYELTNIERRCLDVNFQVTYMPLGEGEAGYKKETEDKLNTLFNTETTIQSQTEFSLDKRIKNFNLAVQRIHQYGLEQETQIQRLIRGRNPNDSVLVKSQKVVMSKLNDINEYHDIAFSLTSAGSIFKMSTNIKKALEIKKSLSIEFEIWFDESEKL